MNIDILRAQERVKYEWLNRNTNYGESFHAKGRVDSICELFEEFNINSVLDVGTGRGHFCKWVEENTHIDTIYGADIAMDPAFTPTDRLNFIKCGAHNIQLDGSVDCVTSFDFFEHVVEDDIDNILTEMNRVCTTLHIHKVHYVTDNHNGQSTSYRDVVGELHQTRKSIDWWLDKFSNYGKAEFLKESRLYIIEL